MKVHSAIAKSLVDHGIDTMFGLIGDANMYLVDSFVREHRGNYIAAAHEAGATLMALGYAALSGKVGVATVTLGPGLVNAVSALIEGTRGSMPMVLLCGDTAPDDRDSISRVCQRDFVLATGAGFEELRSPKTLTQDIATAFQRARIERRPIALNMPLNLQWEEIDYQPLIRKVADGRAFVPTSADLDDAIGIIATAKRPLVLVGRGAMNPQAKAAILRLARRIDALLATTLKAKDLFRGEEHDLGIFGTLSTPETFEAIRACDCVIAFGASLNDYTTARGSLLKGKRVVQINLEQSEVGRYAQSTAGVVGDSVLVADTIGRWLDEAEVQPSGFRAEMKYRMAGTASAVNKPAVAGQEGTLIIRPALERLNAAIPSNRVLVTDAGRFMSQAWAAMPVSDPRYFIPAVNFGAIGLGLAEAIGAAVAVRDRPTVLVTGDGGFTLGGLVEFNTAVRYRCDLIVVVCNDGSYGAEHVKFRSRDMDPGVSLFDWPDFGPVATALGGTGFTVRTNAELERAVRAIEDRQRPLLIDLKLDPDQVPPLPH